MKPTSKKHPEYEDHTTLGNSMGYEAAKKIAMPKIGKTPSPRTPPKPKKKNK